MTFPAGAEALDLDGILSEWHAWADAKGVGRGWSSRSLVCGDFRVSRQYDDANGALDSDLHDSRMVTVDFHVGEIGQPHNAALHCAARALHCGWSVWHSPRIAEADREQVLQAAREMLLVRLRGAGVLW